MTLLDPISVETNATGTRFHLTGMDELTLAAIGILIVMIEEQDVE